MSYASRGISQRNEDVYGCLYFLSWKSDAATKQSTLTAVFLIISSVHDKSTYCIPSMKNLYEKNIYQYRHRLISFFLFFVTVHQGTIAF
jgi:hypothetical protein